jgi:hypothetical protein
MIRRLVWFASGVVAGISAFLWTKNKVSAAAEKMSPTGIGRRSVARVRGFGTRMSHAVQAGRNAMNNKEQQLRDKRQR